MKPVDATARLRAFAEQYETQEEAARALGISGAYLSDLLRNRRTWSDAMLEKLGLTRIVVEAR
jgi:transcriptional regulator with XRE-family HTH domain